LIKKKWRVRTYWETIVRVSRDDLQPGRLAQLFQGGAKAVILTGDERIAQVWEGLCGVKSGDAGRAREERLPWESSILNTARNHRSGIIELGDMLRFIPGALAHIARKTIIFQEPDQQELQAIPNNFWNGNEWISLPPDLLRIVWELMSYILRSAWPDGPEHPPYAVVIERLKYPRSTADLDQICHLLADSGGQWTRIGQRVDAYKAMAVGPFDIKVIRDLFAWLSLIPGVGRLLHRVNKFLRNFSRKNVPGETRLVGDPHVDGSKVFTALASDRDVLITEVYDGKDWLELPLSPDTLTIFPAKQSSPLGMTPTLHRILMKEPPQISALFRPNITLVFAVVDRPSASSVASFRA
jgi:hypothetical protein